MKANILIIDDDQNKLDSLELILRSLDQNIIKCLSGAEGLRAILANEVAVILLDVNMPVMDGFETAKLIRNRVKSSGIPIIFITAYNTGELDVAKGYSMGAVDYIFFPFNEAFLLAKLKVFLEIYFLRKNEQLQAQEMAEVNNKLLTTNERLTESEKQLVMATKSAEDANRMKSEFLANMSHEIRTPLNAIVGFSNILKEKATGNRIYSEYLDNIMQSSEILLNLINDILDLSKVEAGRMVIDLQPVSLTGIVKEIQAVFQMKASEKGISLNISIAENIPGCLITDEKYLRQILFNLVGNAVKFTHKGSIDIILNKLQKEVEIECSKISLEFQVKDSGIGIPADQINSIFEPFIQVAHKERNKYGGTGLGLSITKRLVELLGGTITVESQVGRGSVFSFSVFDIEIASLRNDENKSEKGMHLSGIRFKNPVLLLTEDVLSNRQVVKGYLESLNVTIIEAENGEECLNAIRKQRPDLILMDIQMPVMDGFTAINILKSDNKFKKIPIIALTASGMKQQKDKFEKIADDFLIKPVYKNDLLEKLMKYLPYEELSETKIIQEKGVEDVQTQNISESKLSPEIKKEIVKTFLPTIIKLQEALNIDALIDFVKKFEEYNKKNQIPEIASYCKLLSGYIQTFNIEKINSTLKHLVKDISK